MKKAVLLREQDCFLRILQILLIGVIALDGVEHVALEVARISFCAASKLSSRTSRRVSLCSLLIFSRLAD